MTRRVPPQDAGLLDVHVDMASSRDLASIAQIDADALGSARRRALLKRAIKAGSCFVARTPDDVVGFAILDRSFFGEAYLSLLIVARDYRRMGVGRALVRHVESRIPGRKLFTSTNRSNRPMQRFCAALGFVRSGVVENLDEGDPELIYVKWARGPRDRGR